MQARPITAALAILFAGLTVAAYGSGTGPWTTGDAGPDVIDALPAVTTVTATAPTAPKRDADNGKHGDDNGKHGDRGHGLGSTYCQSLKGTGGPAFGHCIAAKAHELHQHGKHR